MDGANRWMDGRWKGGRTGVIVMSHPDDDDDEDDDDDDDDNSCPMRKMYSK